MRAKLAGMAAGLVLAIALGAPAAAQAAVKGAGPAGIKTTAAAPEASLSCAPMDDLGNNHYAGWTDSTHTYIYFGVDLSHAIPYCNVSVGNGWFFIEEEINGQLSGKCLSAGLLGMGDYACDSDAYWRGINVGTYHSQSVWEFNSFSADSCLYDDLQDPATESSCNTSDAFEHFVWDALP